MSLLVATADPGPTGLCRRGHRPGRLPTTGPGFGTGDGFAEGDGVLEPSDSLATGRLGARAEAMGSRERGVAPTIFAARHEVPLI
jgi:hypothetical protein